MLKAIVFDFDGVLVDSEPLHYRAFLRIAEPLGVRFTYQEYLRTYIGYDDRDAFRVMLGLQPGRPGTPAEEERVHQMGLDKALAFQAVVDEGIEPIPGMIDLVREAGSAMPIAIASGATIADIRLILNKLQLAELFQVIVTADDVERSKPDPQTYRLAVEKLSRRHADKALTPGECLSIEDTAAGIASARGAGLMSLGLATSGNPADLHAAHRVELSAEGLNVSKLRQWFGA